MKRLSEFGEFLGGERGVWVCGEIWKIEEESVGGRLSEVIGDLSEKEGGGEMVMVVGGKEE